MRFILQTVVTFLVFTCCLGLATSQLSAQTLTEKLSQEDAKKLAADAQQRGNIVRGAILFHQGNINCAKCHRGGSQANPTAPDLSQLNSKTTNEHLVESILQPSKQISKGFETTLIATVDGRTITGIVVEKNEKEIQLREMGDQIRIVKIAIDNIEQMKPSKKSTMPEGLADELKDRQQFLDLLKYVFDLRNRKPTGTSG